MMVKKPPLSYAREVMLISTCREAPRECRRRCPLYDGTVGGDEYAASRRSGRAYMSGISRFYYRHTPPARYRARAALLVTAKLPIMKGFHHFSSRRDEQAGVYLPLHGDTTQRWRIAFDIADLPP